MSPQRIRKPRVTFQKTGAEKYYRTQQNPSSTRNRKRSSSDIQPGLINSENGTETNTKLDPCDQDKERTIKDSQMNQEHKVTATHKTELDMLHPKSIGQLTLGQRKDDNDGDENESELWQDIPTEEDSSKSLSDMFADLGLCRYLRRAGTDLAELNPSDIFNGK